MVEPRRVNRVARKHVLIYIEGTMDYGMDYMRGVKVIFSGYIESNWVGCVVDRKTT
jgi:hypothetical protein